MIVFGVLIAFIAAAVIVIVCYKRRVRREKMMKKLEDNLKMSLRKSGLNLPTDKAKIDDVVQEDDIFKEEVTKPAKEAEDNVT